MDTFRRHGAELSEADKAKLAEMDVELSKLTTKFGENVLDATNAFELMVTDERQSGRFAPTAVAAARQSAQQKGQEGWRFTLQAPSYTPVLTYLDDRAIREQVYRAHSTRASSGEKDNRGNRGAHFGIAQSEGSSAWVRQFRGFRFVRPHGAHWWPRAGVSAGD